MRLRLALLLTGALVVGACGGGATPSPSSSPKPSSTPAASDIFAQSPAPSEAASPEPAASAAPSTPAGGKTYTVKKDDTLWDISLKFGVTLAALRAANPTIVDPRTLRAGTVLRIPPK
jgi:LysM repeat protein